MTASVEERHAEGVLCLFPRLDKTGGIQLAGQHARAALEERCGAGKVSCVEYDSGRTRLRAVIDMVTAHRSPLVLVWHLDLLKLLPFRFGRSPRVVLFLHGVECWRPLSQIEGLLLRRVSRTLSNSHHTWRAFTAHNPGLHGRRNDVVHLGSGEPVPLPSEPSSVPTAVMLGRMEADEDYKGHREVIAAWPLVLERHHEARLMVIGGGSLRPALEALAANLGVSARVDFCGPVPDDERDRLLRASRCMLLPSRGEGFGLAYVEAMRLGRPCLVSDRDAGREVINPPDAGLAVNPSDREAVATSIARLLEPGSEWNQWAARSSRLYAERFTATAFKRRLVDALLED